LRLSLPPAGSLNSDLRQFKIDAGLPTQVCAIQVCPTQVCLRQVCLISFLIQVCPTRLAKLVLPQSSLPCASYSIVCSQVYSIDMFALPVPSGWSDLVRLQVLLVIPASGFQSLRFSTRFALCRFTWPDWSELVSLSPVRLTWALTQISFAQVCFIQAGPTQVSLTQQSFPSGCSPQSCPT